MRVFLILLFFPVQLFAQNYNHEELYLPVNNGILRYEGIVDAPGINAEQLYLNSKVWFLDTFKSSKDVITFQDPEIGIVSGNGNFNIYSKFMNQTIERTVYFTVRIEVKDNRFRYFISDLKVGSAISEPYPVQLQFSPEYLFKKNGKPVESEWGFAWNYEKQIIAIEKSIQASIPQIKKEDW